MSGPAKAIDVAALDQLGTDLTRVSTEFGDANSHSDAVAGAVGQTRLAETVSHFAHNWDDKRAKMTDAVKALGDAATNVADAWRDFDQQGADALTGASTDSKNQVP